MSWPATTRNAALDGVTITQLSAHSGFPGSTGANELTGTPYARKNATFNAASGGLRVLAAPVVFDMPPSASVSYIGAWNGATFVGYAANGGAAPRNFVSQSTDDTIRSPGHPYTNGDKVAFIYGSAPAGITAGTIYYARDVDANSFRLASTPGGTALSIGDSNAQDCWVVGITIDTYPASTGSTHSVTSASFMFAG
jgi:hypothetical protein